MRFSHLFSLLFAILLSACASSSLSTPRAISSATLLAPFALTPQHAQANSQATIAAGQAVRSDLDITATALSLQGIQANLRATEISSQITQAAATSETFIRQTEASSNTTATAEVAIAATHAANMAFTQSAAETATAWPQTATPLAATQISIVAEANNTERRAYWNQFIVPFKTLFFGILLVLLLLGAFYFYRRFLPVWELRLRTIVSPDGETITYLPAGEEIKALLPGRSFGSALHSGKDETIVSGVASDLTMQDRVVARNQAIRLTASLPPGKTPQQAQRLLNAGSPAEEKETPVFRILQPTERPPLLDGDTLDILEGKWSEDHDN
jgi:hypothetical protein